VIEVAAAVIERPDGAFLLARRPAGKVYAGYWEFPGGKIEGGEPAERAIARELHEELALDVERAYPWITRTYTYPHGEVRLQFFRVRAWRGEIHPKENQEIRWQSFSAPMAAPMLPANAPVLAALALPVEYAITDAEGMGAGAMLEKIAFRLSKGLKLIQVRDKQLKERGEFMQSVVALARRHGAKVLVNGEIGGDGVHYTAAQLMALKERPQGVLAAASCHTAEEIARAMALQLDFAVLGPVKDKAAIGWKRFTDLAKGASLPIYAIGGLTRADVEDAWRAGAHGLAMIRGSWG
jgi:8-oxo-dGTP diphosphatase